MLKQLTIIIGITAALAGHISTASYGADIGNWTASYSTSMGTITHTPTRITVDFGSETYVTAPNNGFDYTLTGGSTSYRRIPFVAGEQFDIPGFVPQSTLTLIPQSSKSDFENALRQIGWIK